jgi:uncharacterized protein YkwD
MRMRAPLHAARATPATPANRRRILVVAVVMVAMFILSVAEGPVAGADGDGYRQKLLRLLNQTRASHGLGLLKIDRSLSDDARVHTHRMVREDQVYDPYNLAAILSDYAWDDVGADVVGCAATIPRLHKAWMNHDAHRVILLNGNLRRVGIGVVQNDTRNHCGRGSIWATEIFYG